MIRIIAGEFKGRRLKTPAGDAVRPTADRVREAWFSILQRAMRGARVQANIKTLHVDDRAMVRRLDALKFAERLHPGQYDVAFADPPYAGDQAARLVAMFRVNAFARIFTIEHPADRPIPGDDTRRYGDTAVTFIYAP